MTTPALIPNAMIASSLLIIQYRDVGDRAPCRWRPLVGVSPERKTRAVTRAAPVPNILPPSSAKRPSHGRPRTTRALGAAFSVLSGLALVCAVLPIGTSWRTIQRPGEDRVLPSSATRATRTGLSACGPGRRSASLSGPLTALPCELEDEGIERREPPHVVSYYLWE